MAKVLSVRRIQGAGKVCDVTVADNHNLFVRDKISQRSVLVHNCLDENLKYLGGQPFNTPQFGLEQIFMDYGNDHYKTAPFGKGDRANPNLTRLSNPDFIRYGGMDCQSIYGIHLKQMEEAKTLKIGQDGYGPAYKRLVLNQFSATVHVLSTMKQVGSTVDKEYLKKLAGAHSPLKKLIKESKAHLLTHEQVKRANKILLAESSGQQSNKGLFGRTQTVFSWGKPQHRKTLFFGVMKLKPITFSKETGEPKVDKVFIAAYKDQNIVVKDYGEYNKLVKLYSTYVKGWLKVLNKNVDSLADYRLRPDYAFAPVVTGRLNSSKPSLQQVPTHGDVAKYIKRMFVALEGRLLFKFDYSAHEIRCWSYVSGDTILAKAFRQGQRLRQQYRASPIPEILTELKTKGDMHIYNCFLFFQKWIEKSDPLRDAVKKIVFGVIYGKGIKTLAKDIGQTPEFAQNIVDKLYTFFPKASKWLTWSMGFAMEHLYTYSPVGMRRNLFGIMTGLKGLIAAMRRRAANSPIQGLASQIGVMAARLITLELYKVLLEFGYIDKTTEAMPVDITKAVHDALHAEPPYEMMLIVIHVVQWVATYGVTEYYERVYGLKFTIEPEIEIEIGASEDKMYKWDWTDEQLDKIFKDSLDDQVKLGFCKNAKKAYDQVMEPYRNKELRAYLEQKYPILGIEPVRKLRKKAETGKNKNKEKETAT